MKKMLWFWLLFFSINTSILRCSADVKIQDKSIDAVKLEEIILMLDTILLELPAFVETYELNSSLTWDEWKKKYWFIAPVGTVLLVLKFYLVLTSIFKSSKNDKTFSV